MTDTLPRRGECRVKTCTEPRVKGAFLCSEHLGDKRRCEGRVITRDDDGEVTEDRQCKRTARAGMTVCGSHGGRGRVNDAVVARTSALTAMQRFVTPYSGDLDPITAFELEFRRTYGRIIWLEQQIADLTTEDLIWGMTKEETIEASEFGGTNRTFEARINIWEDMLRWERKHFLELEKTWIRANLDEKRLNIMRDHISYTYQKVVETARILGHNPDDPKVRAALMALFGGDRSEQTPALGDG